MPEPTLQTPGEFAAALARGDVIEPGTPITSSYRDMLTRLIVEVASARLHASYRIGALLPQAPDLTAKLTLSQLVNDRSRQAFELFRLLEALAVDAAHHVVTADRQYEGAAHQPAATWYPLPRYTSYLDLVGYEVVTGCAERVLVEDLHASSWGPLRRVARAITRDDLPHQAASLRLLDELSLAVETRQQAFDTSFGHAIAWFASSDAPFAATCRDLRLRAHDTVATRARFEQQLRELAITAELAPPAFISA